MEVLEVELAGVVQRTVIEAELQGVGYDGATVAAVRELRRLRPAMTDSQAFRLAERLRPL